MAGESHVRSETILSTCPFNVCFLNITRISKFSPGETSPQPRILTSPEEVIHGIALQLQAAQASAWLDEPYLVLAGKESASCHSISSGWLVVRGGGLHHVKYPIQKFRGFNDHDCHIRMLHPHRPLMNFGLEGESRCIDRLSNHQEKFL